MSNSSLEMTIFCPWGLNQSCYDYSCSCKIQSLGVIVILNKTSHLRNPIINFESFKLKHKNQVENSFIYSEEQCNCSTVTVVILTIKFERSFLEWFLTKFCVPSLCCIVYALTSWWFSTWNLLFIHLNAKWISIPMNIPADQQMNIINQRLFQSTISLHFPI